MAIVLATLSALLFGTADFAGGLASRKNSVSAVLINSQIVGLAVVLLFSLLDRSAGTPALLDLVWGALAGLCGMVGLATLYRGLARGLVAIVSPLAALLGAMVPVLFGLLGGEAIQTSAGIGIAVSFPAIVCISWHSEKAHGKRDPHRMRRSWLAGLIAGAMFGLFFILISLSATEAGMWPLAAARVSSVTAMALVAWVSRRAVVVRTGHGAVAAAGTLDMAANIAFVLALRHGVLAIVSVVIALAPTQTVLLSRIVFGERVGAVRIVGIVLAIIGVALLSI